MWLKLFHFYASFKGRATRREFNMLYALVAFIGTAAAILIDLSMVGWDMKALGVNPPVMTAWNVIILVPTFSFICRRLHDLDFSGWWQLPVYLIPVGLMGWGMTQLRTMEISLETGVPMTVMIICGITLTIYLGFFVILSCKRGTVGPNKFGDDPLAKV